MDIVFRDPCACRTPKVSVQKLHVHEQAKKRAKVNPVEELIQALLSCNIVKAPSTVQSPDF